MIPLKKILKCKLTEHCAKRMEQRRISVNDIEEVLFAPDSKEKQPWKDRVILQKKIKRGYVTVILNSSEKSLKTCWVC